MESFSLNNNVNPNVMTEAAEANPQMTSTLLSALTKLIKIKATPTITPINPDPKIFVKKCGLKMLVKSRFLGTLTNKNRVHKWIKVKVNPAPIKLISKSTQTEAHNCLAWVNNSIPSLNSSLSS